MPSNRRSNRDKSFVDAVSRQINLSLETRMNLAVQFLQTRVVKNISKPVKKEKGKTGRIQITERSKPGEFPRADTTQLMKSIFSGVRKINGGIEGFVGTPLDYGLILETRLDRSFLVRTLQEESGNLGKILGSAITSP